MERGDMAEHEPAAVAVIGLGSMGYGIAASLARAGFRVTGCDARPAALARFAQEHGRAEENPAIAAAGAAILVVVVVNADETEHVLFGLGGAADALPAGAVIVSCATMAPARARALARQAEERGLGYVDAPMSGGSARAAEGALTVLASGAPAAMEKAAPALEAMSSKLYRLGAEPGLGASFKMVHPLLAGVATTRRPARSRSSPRTSASSPICRAPRPFRPRSPPQPSRCS